MKNLTKKYFLLALFLMGILSNNSLKAQAVNQPQPPVDSLSLFRDQIDALDAEIIKLLGRRMQVAEQVGAYKARRNMPPLQQGRFEAILKKNIELGKAVNLSEACITEVMNAIHKESLSRQQVKMPGH
ncbi:chorismate mutase [Runella sp.]|uniref:chorismate mutase n=1 Tax=Runella sp. TaxID=1960881 RepID=UPI003D126559